MVAIAVRPASKQKTALTDNGRSESIDQQRIAALNALRRQITGASLEDRQVFHRAITGARDLLGYTDADLAETFSCSRMTANRWIRGEAAPFAGMRTVVFKHLTKDIDRHLRALLGR